MNRAGDGMASPSRLHREGRLCLHTTSQSASQTAPLVGESLAKPFTLRGLPKPPLGRGGGSASALTERLSLARASRSGCPLYNLSVCFADSSPSRGASGEEAKFYEMLRPSLGRSNSSKRNPTPAHSTINKQKRRRRLSNRQRRFAYSVNSGQWIRPWPRCCARPSCRRRRSGTRCSGPERSAGQPG